MSKPHAPRIRRACVMNAQIRWSLPGRLVHVLFSLYRNIRLYGLVYRMRGGRDHRANELGESPRRAFL